MFSISPGAGLNPHPESLNPHPESLNPHPESLSPHPGSNLKIKIPQNKIITYLWRY
jgi:hypothetical protein